MGAEIDGVIDCAIIGGGMGGVYSAWRLATAPESKVPAAGIHLFEMSDRIGGRLDTVRLPGMPHVPAELGGMRIMTSQSLVMGLVQRLGFKTEPFPMGGKQNLAYLRSHRFQVGQYGDASVVPYWLTGEELGKPPSKLVVQAIETVIPGASSMSNEELRKACAAATLNGFPLRQHGFWQVLLNALSIEAYNLALAGGGFNTVLTNWNAAEAIPWYMEDWSIPADQTAYVHLPEGYEALPRRLCDEFEAAGGRVHLRRELIAFSRREDGLYALTIHDHGVGRDHVVLARRLVLAMPRRSLDRIAEHPLDRAGPSEFFAKPGVADLLATVTGQALYKFALAYPQPWWHALDLESGDSVTDLPLRQIYYFETEGDMPGGDPGNRNSLLVAAYTDGISVDFWEGVRHSGPRFEGRPNPFVAAGEARLPDIYDVSALMVAEAHRQLLEVHGVTDAPEPYAAAFRDWGDDPYGGGWHSWNIGVDTAAVMPRIVKPVADEEVYICGESYSTYQGWVEGALQTAEMMLTGHFGLAPAPAGSPAA
ncbi:FAD-dependent oxidoreductase [Inquilinus sp. Marseille-Q2685]|uniref:flavin monoamine oxidase family protein n=1 Tax=Inquilinus sp. Marseille-Q2685 TaxID=2866581 RepID=UPI001CE426A5|nr:FAD-dependent oxidoreductase [Inquilinus sp. Marseille-Q2685]